MVARSVLLKSRTHKLLVVADSLSRVPVAGCGGARLGLLVALLVLGVGDPAGGTGFHGLAVG